MSGEKVRSDEMWLRMTQLAYKDLTEEEYQKEIKRIYVGEYGKRLTADMKVYPSPKAPNLKKGTPRCVGTAVYFQSDSHHIDEV